MPGATARACVLLVSKTKIVVGDLSVTLCHARGNSFFLRLQPFWHKGVTVAVPADYSAPWLETSPYSALHVGVMITMRQFTQIHINTVSLGTLNFTGSKSLFQPIAL